MEKKKDNTIRILEKIFLNLCLMEAYLTLSIMLIFLNAKSFRKFKNGKTISNDF